MAHTQFTRNYRDHSNNAGFQFEFQCDKCGNGFRSSFVANTLGIAASLLKAAGNMFGASGLSSAGAGADHVKDALRGQAWDRAFNTAIDELKPKFRQCTKCGKWVCPEVCWNEQRKLCEECAPDLGEHAAAIQASVAVEQLQTKAREVDQTAGVDMSAKLVASCPHCNARVGTGKFCPECGKPLAAETKCGKCGASVAATAKFCAECGTPRA